MVGICRQYKSALILHHFSFLILVAQPIARRAAHTCLLYFGPRPRRLPRHPLYFHGWIFNVSSIVTGEYEASSSTCWLKLGAFAQVSSDRVTTPGSTPSRTCMTWISHSYC